tara:strand:+ start:794 stop:1297 length:504 start_codon:yes stop_codon:yes gene_type:complete
LATKKGIMLTVIIIGSFVAASFLIYLIPEEPQSTIITFGDPREELEFAIDRTSVVIDGFQEVFVLWKNGEVYKNTYDSTANVTIDQLNMMIIELKGKPIPNEWNQSYVLFIQSLENYKEYIEKTKEYVNYKSVNQNDPKKESVYLDTMSKTFDRALGLMQESINVMP